MKGKGKGKRHSVPPTAMAAPTAAALVSSLSALSLTTTTTPVAEPSAAAASSSSSTSRDPSRPFRYFDLPSELRIAILEHLLTQPAALDLDPSNARHIAPLLRLFLVSRRMRAEATQVFYASNTVRLFPIHGRFFHTKRPLLTRLPSEHRGLLTALELRLGPGWNAPPRGWKIVPALGLPDLAALRRLVVFVEFDPAANEVFRGFRVDDDFYTNFCRAILRELFAAVHRLDEVVFDARMSVELDSPLVCALLDETKAVGKKISWGKKRGWSDAALLQVEAKRAVAAVQVPKALAVAASAASSTMPAIQPVEPATAVVAAAS